MPSLVVTGLAQALVLGAISNILAQIISAQKDDRPFTFNVGTFLFFLTWTLVSCPPNILWQIYLEETYPANKVDERGRKVLDKSNTLKKFLMDQSIAATANTVGYIAALAAFRGKDATGIIDQVKTDFWPLMQTGYKFWPFVALLSFTVVPLNRRTLFGSTVGLFWGIYMSLLAAD